MVDLFTLTGLTVASAMGSSPRYDVTTDDGTPLGTVAMSDIALDGRVRRWFGNPAEYPFTLTVSDAAGGTVLTVDKEREGTLGCYFEVLVRLADGREIGRVRQRWPLSTEVTFHGSSDASAEAELATAPAGRFTADLAVNAVTAGATQWARVAVETSGPDRRYRLSFAGDAPTLVRALTLGYVTARDAQLFPSGRAY